MSVKINRITKMFEEKYPQFIGADEDNMEYNILHPYTESIDNFKDMIQKYYGITDTDMQHLLIWNIDLSKYQPLPRYYEYIKNNGLKNAWDNGSND